MAQLIVPPENGPVGIALGQDLLIEPEPDMLLAENCPAAHSKLAPAPDIGGKRCGCCCRSKPCQ